MPTKTKKPQFTKTQILRLPRLLNMMYKPSELANEIGASLDTVRRYIPHGLPVTKDSTGHVWINGAAFRDWVNSQLAEKREKKKNKLPAGKAYCVSCRGVVDFPKKPVRVIPSIRWVELWQAPCPVCGKTINKPVKRERN